MALQEPDRPRIKHRLVVKPNGPDNKDMHKHTAATVHKPALTPHMLAACECRVTAREPNG
jgi:hypothetical protein